MSVHTFGEGGVVLADDETLGATPPTVESAAPYVMFDSTATSTYHYRAAAGATASEITFNCPTYTKLYMSCRFKRGDAAATLVIRPVSGATVGEGFGLDPVTGSFSLMSAAGAVTATGAGDPSAFPTAVGGWDKLGFVFDAGAGTINVIINGRASATLTGAAATLANTTGVLVSFSHGSDLDELYLVDVTTITSPRLGEAAIATLRPSADDATRAHWWASTPTRTAMLSVVPPELTKYTRMAGLGEQGYDMDDPTGLDPVLTVLKARTRAFGTWTTNPVLALSHNQGGTEVVTDVTLVADGAWTWAQRIDINDATLTPWTIANLTTTQVATTTKDQ